MNAPQPPITLPAVGKIAGGRIRFTRTLDTPALALAVCTDPAETVRTLAHPDDWDALDKAVADPYNHAIDVNQLRAAGSCLAARLCGMPADMSGWRTAVRLCGSLLSDPPGGWAIPLSAGVDPSASPLWVVCAAVWSAITSGKKDDEVKQIRIDLSAPLLGDHTWAPAMPRATAKPPPDPRSRAERQKRAMKNMRSVRAIKAGQLR